MDFKKRVIQPSIEQINEHSPLWVKWDQRKTGRRVSHLVFTFGEKAPGETGVDANKSNKHKPKRKSNQSAQGAIYGIPTSVIEAAAQPGESYEDAALRLLEEAAKRKK